MSSAIFNVTFDCADPRALARFWGQVTGWPVIEEPEPGYEESAVGTPGVCGAWKASASCSVAEVWMNTT